jgi:hypothetical protein
MLRLMTALMLPVVVCAQETAVATASLDRLGWLAGQWRSERSGRVVDEQWMAPAGGLMLGMSRTVAKGRVLEYEFLQIREGPGGELFFVAQPARQKEAAFKLVAQTDTEATFENKEHDFPQVIVYSLRNDGSLLAYIEGPKADGTTRRIEYSYRRLSP